MLFSNYIAVDIGTENIRVADAESGRVVSEPCVIAVLPEDGAICEMGAEAKRLMESVPGSCVGVYPVKEGVIADFNMLQALLAYMVRKIKKGFSLIQPKAVVAVPSGLTAMQKRELEDAAKAAGIRDICLMDAPVAAAVGMGEDVAQPRARMVLLMGAGLSEIAVICMNRLIAYKRSTVAGARLDAAISAMLKKELDIWAGGRIAETLKKEVGLRDLSVTETVCGKNLTTGLPTMVSVTGSEVAKTLRRPILELILEIREILSTLPEELVRDIQEDGILLAGGSAHLGGLRELISNELGLAARIAANPENAVINGALQAACELNDGGTVGETSARIPVCE